MGLKVAEGDIGVAVTRVKDSAPVAAGAAGAAAGFGRPLAFDAAGGVGKGIEASNRYAISAAFAFAVGPVFDSNQGTFDTGEFAAFDFGELRADFILSGIERGVDDIAAGLLAELLEQAQVAGQGLANGIATHDQKFAHLFD